ncbi:MAG: hypothetical protein CMJ64_28305 [Planctomycetaceae bacterium]|nr:hypothetical protein [Planctomycetaceae bacterium]
MTSSQLANQHETRRDFLKQGATGLAALGVSTSPHAAPTRTFRPRAEIDSASTATFSSHAMSGSATPLC